MKYEDFDITDFLQDDFFMDWVRNGSPEANEFWQKWLRLHPENSDIVFRAKQLALSIELNEPQSALSEEEFLSLYEQIVRGRKNRQGMNEVHQEKRTVWPYLKMVAAVLLLVIPAIFLWTSQGDKDEIEPVAERPLLEWRATENPKGQKSTIKLPDGSVVRLNANSTLRYPTTFYHDERRIILEGEAFFDVTRDTVRPFIVETGNVETRVLGTSFNIKTGDVDTDLKVAVVSGKVAVSHAEGERVLLAVNEVAAFSPETKVFEKQLVADMKSYVGWKEGIIYFKDATFGEVVSLLENWYGVEINLTGAPLKGRYSGEYAQETLKNVLVGFCYTSGCTFTLDGKKVQIYNQ